MSRIKILPKQAYGQYAQNSVRLYINEMNTATIFAVQPITGSAEPTDRTILSKMMLLFEWPNVTLDTSFGAWYKQLSISASESKL